jgi:hypothetical protein
MNKKEASERERERESHGLNRREEKCRAIIQ